VTNANCAAYVLLWAWFAHSAERRGRVCAAGSGACRVLGTAPWRHWTAFARFDLYTLSVVAGLDPTTVGWLTAWCECPYGDHKEAFGSWCPECCCSMPLLPLACAPVCRIGAVALQLSGHLDAEVKRARTSLALPDPKIAGPTSYPDAPGSGIAALPEICATGHRACALCSKHPA